MGIGTDLLDIKAVESGVKYKRNRVSENVDNDGFRHFSIKRNLYLAYCMEIEYNLLCVLLAILKHITLRTVEVVWK